MTEKEGGRGRGKESRGEREAGSGRAKKEETKEIESGRKRKNCGC